MGWTGTIMYWGRKATNKDLFLEAYPSYKRALDEGRIKLSQKGSNVFVLFQRDVPSSEHYGKYGVIEFLCRREPNEFITKDIDAVDNLCFGFPKSWCDFLDKSDPDVQKYLAARAEFEAKEKSKCKPEIGDVLECVASREISWSDGHSIAKGEKFYVTVGTLNPWSAKKQKAYIQARPGTVWKNGEWKWEMSRTNYRIGGSSFKSLESVKKLSADEVKAIVDDYVAKMKRIAEKEAV